MSKATPLTTGEFERFLELNTEWHRSLERWQDKMKYQKELRK
jgi:hypothetical protein